MFAPLAGGAAAAHLERGRSGRDVLADVGEDEKTPSEADVPDARDNETEMGPLQHFVVDLVTSDVFQYGTAFVIVSNVFVMCLRADFPDWDCWPVVDAVFLVFFTVELTLRIFAYRCHFFCEVDPCAPADADRRPKASTDELGWNRFDFIVVALGWLDFLSEKVGGMKAGGGRSFMIIRVVRILRVLRLLRVIKAFKPLTLLVAGLVESLVNVFWIMLFMFVVMCVFAIFTTTQFGRKAREYGSNAPDIEQNWGSCWKSIMTLFTFLTLDDWANMTREVAWPGKDNPNPPLICFLSMCMLVCYVILTAFIILSLLTGTIADQMDKVKQMDREEELNDDRKKFQEALGKFYHHFKCHSDVHSKALDLQAFGCLLKYQPFIDDLGTVGLSIEESDRDDIFEAFDLDGNQLMHWDELKNGLLELRSHVTKKQYFKLQAIIQTAVDKKPQEEFATEPSPKSMAKAVDTKLADVTKQMRLIDACTDTVGARVQEALERLRRQVAKQELGL